MGRKDGEELMGIGYISGMTEIVVVAQLQIY